MKLIKILGLTAVAAMVAMAFVGASSASADATHIVLCEKAELECGSPLKNATPVGTSEYTITAHATNPELKTSLGTVICKKSLTETTLLNELGTLGLGHIKTLTFEECALGKTACTVTVTSFGLLSFTKTGPLTGNAKSTGGTKANVHCGFLINCNYGGEPTLAVHTTSVEDENKAVLGLTQLLATENTVLAEEGEKFVCPDESKWIATYDALGSMWIES